MDWGFNTVDVANGVGVVLITILGALGIWKGASGKGQQSAVAEVAGALVDSSAVNKLTAAIEAHNVETMQNRRMWEKGINAVEDLRDEMHETRQTIQRLGDVMLQRR
jgi:hypothetical protein